MDACNCGVGFLSQASVSWREFISGAESFGPTARELWAAQQIESFSGKPCARKWSESTESLFFSRACRYSGGVIPGFSRACPWGEGLEFAATSAAVGAAIFGKGWTGAVKNMVLRDIGRHLTSKGDRDDAAPAAL